MHNECFLDSVAARWKNADGTFNYIDPTTGEMVRNAARAGLAGDHLLPKASIKNAGGWSELSSDVQKRILNDPNILMPLPRGMNSSKQARVQFDRNGGWVSFAGKPLDPGFKSFLQDHQLAYRTYLSETYGLKF